ncbi:MAG: hypothetical protein CME70_02240 [Halobacteriovorax sp.]|nr:hypothetical protein [Halobacteriovorax sp.]|tara:strand:+ start:76474 stop:78612 length:2139 start_codon:yes stop_codon:yes gene_type:complete
MQNLRKTLEIQFLVTTTISLLFVSIFFPSQALANCSYPNDQRMAEKQRNCTNDSARTWMCEMNRCVTTAEAQGLREKFKECAELKDDTARKKCHDDFARNESNTTSGKKGAKKGFSMTAATINGLNAAMLFLSNTGKSPGGQCISRKTYMAASIVSVLAELYMMMMVDKKLKKLQKKYEGEQLNEEAYAAQTRALQYLKEEQQTIADMAKSRKNAYTLQLALYGATAVIATLEVTTGMTYGVPAPCLSKDQQDKKREKIKEDNDKFAKQKKGLEDKGAPFKAAEGKELTADQTKMNAEHSKASSDLKSGQARQERFESEYGDGKETKTAKKGKKGADKAKGALKSQATGALAGYADILGTSQMILITSGVSTYIAYSLRKAASEQEAEANANVKSVDELISKFSNAMDGSSYCTPAQRENLDNPQCYCYESNGDKNMNRTNSQACVALWAQNERNLMVGAGSYTQKVAPKVRTCMLLNGQVDRACKCRQMINKSTGENACMKVPMGTNNLGSIGTALGVSGLGATVGNLANGNSNFGNLNNNAIGQQAAKNRQLADQAIAKLNNERANNGLAPISPFSEKTAAVFMKALKKQGALKNAPPTAGALAVSARPSGSNLAAAIDKAEGKSGMTKNTFMKGGKGARKSSGGGGGDQFAFLNNGTDGGGKVAGGFASKKYNYKDNDIVKNKGVSIWKVISSRYATSGVRRLFEDDKK